MLQWIPGWKNIKKKNKMLVVAHVRTFLKSKEEWVFEMSRYHEKGEIRLKWIKKLSGVLKRNVKALGRYLSHLIGSHSSNLIEHLDKTLKILVI